MTQVLSNKETGRTTTQREIEAIGISIEEAIKWVDGIGKFTSLTAYYNNRLRSKARDVAVSKLDGNNTKERRMVLYAMSAEDRTKLIYEELAKIPGGTKYVFTNATYSYNNKEFYDRVQSQLEAKPTTTSNKTNNIKMGYIYLMVNISDDRYNGLVKVGRSVRPDSRVGTWHLFDEISIQHVEESYDYIKDEAVVHKALVAAGGIRLSKTKEWFKINMDDAIRIIKENTTKQ